MRARPLTFRWRAGQRGAHRLALVCVDHFRLASAAHICGSPGATKMRASLGAAPMGAMMMAEAAHEDAAAAAAASSGQTSSWRRTMSLSNERERRKTCASSASRQAGGEKPMPPRAFPAAEGARGVGWPTLQWQLVSGACARARIKLQRHVITPSGAGPTPAGDFVASGPLTWRRRETLARFSAGPGHGRELI